MRQILRHLLDIIDMFARKYLSLHATIALLVLGLGLVNYPRANATTTTLGVVYPPWWSTAQIWRAAASTGDILDIGGVPFILYLHSDASGLNLRARRAGAVLVFDPRGFGGCGASARRPFS
jgi:hypothetical protein